MQKTHYEALPGDYLRFHTNYVNVFCTIVMKMRLREEKRGYANANSSGVCYERNTADVQRAGGSSVVCVNT